MSNMKMSHCYCLKCKDYTDIVVVSLCEEKWASKKALKNGITVSRKVARGNCVDCGANVLRLMKQEQYDLLLPIWIENGSINDGDLKE